MSSPRILLLMLAGLALGTGIRLAFSLPVTPENARPRHSTAPHSTLPAAEDTTPPAPSSARPPESEILTSRHGPRYRLLLAWLPAAGEDEILRMARALTMSDASDDLALRLLMVRWAEVNPQAMLEWARTKGPGYHTVTQCVSDAIVAWGRVDFDSAWAAACAGLPGARGSALLALAGTDPDKCLRLLRADPKLLNLSVYPGIHDVLQKLTARDPAATAAFLDSAPPAQRREHASDVAMPWLKKEPAAALAWIKTLVPPAARNALQAEAARWLSAHAPEHLPAVLENLPAGSDRTAIQVETLARVAVTDPNAARRQLDAMPAGPARQYARGVVLMKLFEHGDESTAAALASQLHWRIDNDWTPSHDTCVFGENFDSYGQGNDGRAELTPIREAMSKLFDRIATRDPREAVSILAHCGEGTFYNLLEEVRLSRPDALAEALVTAADETSLKQLDVLAADWMSSDPVAAMSWAGARGPLLTSFFQHWVDISSALEWAAQQPPEKRQPLLQEAVKSWSQSPDRIQDSIRSSPLPEAEKQLLLPLAVPRP